jgi:hypothetical protein
MVPPQYLHKCSGGLFRVGTIVGNPQGEEIRKQTKKKKKKRYKIILCLQRSYLEIVIMRSLMIFVKV